ncbi:hypothetical protein PIB30_090654, partial [Stylosanthes scabra]|nr:hypothetical protein [Stylosanthes scabra]
MKKVRRGQNKRWEKESPFKGGLGEPGYERYLQNFEGYKRSDLLTGIEGGEIGATRIYADWSNDGSPDEGSANGGTRVGADNGMISTKRIA